MSVSIHSFHPASIVPRNANSIYLALCLFAMVLMLGPIQSITPKEVQSQGNKKKESEKMGCDRPRNSVRRGGAVAAVSHAGSFA
jgi:hypothetical protein